MRARVTPEHDRALETFDGTPLTLDTRFEPHPVLLSEGRAFTEVDSNLLSFLASLRLT